MEQYIETLNKYAQEQGIGEGESLLELLYSCFCIQNDLETQAIRQSIQQMDDILKNLSLEDNDTLFDVVCDLCEKYQHEAFRTGLLVGFHLCKELL